MRSSQPAADAGTPPRRLWSRARNLRPASMAFGLRSVVPLLIALGMGLTACSEDVDALDEASPDARTSQIAFVSDRDGPMRIYVMDDDGGRQRPLSDPDSGGDAHPAWSPDGTQIAFASYRDHPEFAEIYVMDADGLNERNITNSPNSHDTHPAWSPDGESIAFASDRDYGPRALDIYIMDADGDAVRSVFRAEEADAMYPAWSPDGAHILYLTPRPDIPTPDIYTVHVMGADGQGSWPAANVRALDPRYAVSPEGRRLATIRRENRRQAIALWNLRGEIGRSARAITSNPQGDDGYPSWSPGGGRIVYASTYRDDADVVVEGRSDIRVVNLNGLGVTELTNSEHFDGMPAWSP